MAYVAARTEGAPGAPLLLTLHGTGGTEAQFHGLGESLLPGAHVVSPRGDVSEGGALRFFRRTGEGVYDMADLARAVAKLGAFVEGERARTGAGRVIGLGYSNGANILAALSFARPALVGELILLHPLIPFDPGTADLSGARVLITAGRRDPICPAPLTARLAAWYRAAGAEVAEHWHEGGHGIVAGEIAAVRSFLAPARAAAPVTPPRSAIR